jgi:predicted dehydrogenase
VGLGRSGWGLHATTISRLPALFQLSAVTDPIPARCREAGERFGAAVYPGVAELAETDDVDLVVIASPSHLHATHAIQALERGKHVLVEKPFAVSLTEADAVFTVAERGGRIATASQNLRYAADFLRVREILASGKLGTVIQITVRRHSFQRRWDWQTLARLGGGTLSNDASHILDQLLLLLGDGGVEVSCRRMRTPLSLGDAEDHVKILISVPDGPIVDLEFSNACAYPQDQWLVFGTQGTLTGGSSHLQWRYFDPELIVDRSVSEEPTPDRTYNREELPWFQEQCDLAAEAYESSHIRLYRSLHRTLRHGQPLDITPVSIRRQMEVLERCRTTAVASVEQAIN